jgi:CRISPR-associated protein Csm4
MNWLELRFVPKGRFRTPINATTLFGQLVWAAHWQGQQVELLLKPFIEGKPTFLLSDAFPCGYLPMPLATPIQRSEAELDLIGQQPLIPIEEWKQVSSDGGWDKCSLLKFQDVPKLEQRLVWEATTRVQIERQSATALEGALFTRGTWHYQGSWVVYVQVLNQDDWKNWQFRAWFTAVGLEGFGGGASVSGGHWEAAELMECKPLGVESANAWMSLAAFAPMGLDLAKTRFELETQRGRVGSVVTSSPWKKPYTRIKTGAVCQTEIPNTPVGAWLNDLARLGNGQAVGDYAYAFPVGVNL